MRNGTSSSSRILSLFKSTSDDSELVDYRGQIEALNKSLAVIQFEMDGTIISANENFLQTMGYELSEVTGKHHSIFVDESTKTSNDYSAFWSRLNKGCFEANEFKRLAKNGREVWIQASYNPIFDESGKPFKVVKFATDITQNKMQSSDFISQIEAINKSQAVIEFSMDGTIRSANKNFLDTLGYHESEVVGQHHSMFVEPEEASSAEYKNFWKNLNQGDYKAGEFKRVGKNAKEIWIQASYNPILDLNGKPYKVVKYASDITEQKILNRETESVLSETTSVMSAMSQGDLTKRVNGEYFGEFKKLKDAVNICCRNLQAMIREVEDVAGQVNNGAKEMAKGNLDLSKRTNEQAASLEETASSMEQMTSAVKQNSENATGANSLVKEVSGKAKNGGSIVKNAVVSMEDLTDSSNKIKDIIGVIDNIAFQTNLLALNASVEAARAGKLGRGFAVVASEVRNLAAKSAEAAKEIKELIEESVVKVETSTQLVNDTGQSLTEIVEGVIEISALVDDIELSGKEQFEGIHMVNKAVTHMDKLTQQNAALVEQIAVASQNLCDQAEDMTQLVQSFNNEPSCDDPVVESEKKVA